MSTCLIIEQFFIFNFFKYIGCQIKKNIQYFLKQISETKISKNENFYD